jgi:hypothetical protein
MDFIGPLPECTYLGYTYRFILVVVDRLTKRVFYIPTKRTTALETAEAFYAYVFRFDGLSDSIISD